ncbi:MAG: hypothetical protein J5532_04860 [Lachnospiraceae bacterium]|nr:hypothetical protein [Lachnospiraceae bacterium]
MFDRLSAERTVMSRSLQGFCELRTGEAGDSAAKDVSKTKFSNDIPAAKYKADEVRGRMSDILYQASYV